jgi:deoxyribonuclease V
LIRITEKRIDLARLTKLQDYLVSKLSLKWEGKNIDLVAGADFGYDVKNEQIGSSIVVFGMPDYEIVEVVQAIQKVRFPYIPAFLSFREGPIFLEAFRQIKDKPDVTLIDGNGIAHPRRMGLASYVGVILNIATFGCAKRPFFPFTSPSFERGAYTNFLNYKKEKVGVCLRTRTGIKPIYISPGHRIDFQTSMELALKYSKFRVPEPLREAHRLSNRMFSL